VLVYASNTDSDFFEACNDFLEGRVADPSPTYFTWNICYEYLRVTHPRVLAAPRSGVEAWAFLEFLLDLESFGLLMQTDRHRQVLQMTLGELPDVRANLIHDLHTAVLIREHGIARIYTRDTDFHRFPFLDVVDPLRA
tara:strand:- start:2415 stop:2828 length:414 start_codon:yes stop_codon:yes gene_type:complete